LDDEGNTLSQIQYQPYGETFVQRGDLNFSPKYNSQELDRESGFYFYNARYYDPGIARFTSADTIIDGEFDTQGWNRFSYVKGNPIGAKDPSGHLGQLIPVAVRVGQGLAAAGMALCSSGKINCGDIVPNKADKPRDTSISPNDAKQIEKSGLDPLNAKKGSQKSIGEDSKNGSNDGGKSGVSNKGNNTGNGSGKSASQNSINTDKRFSKEKQALVEMAKKDKEKGITKDDMKAYKDLNKELSDPFPTNKVRGPEKHEGRNYKGLHGHVGPVDHIPVKDH
ncbi:RHS repeat-associated core domain-containing protein, partial [Leptospira santarosai]|uniref:RHS repeat-associated core domain-containing protein n=1 Tax=Leptospira santarosai TaxID=28183 RepID=UPI0002BEE4E2